MTFYKNDLWVFALFVSSFDCFIHILNIIFKIGWLANQK